MMLPKGDQYVSAVQHPQIAFQDHDLKSSSVETRPTGLPKPYSGAFTITFHLIGTRDWAVRCFTREIDEVKQRYDAITRFLRITSDPLFSRAELLQQGMLVGAHRHDIIKMEWVHGEQLNAYIGRRVNDSAEMKRLADRVLALGSRLNELGMAHGDLQHGNILVTAAGDLRLVDYDDLYLPDIAGLRFSNGTGQENYQHPDRSPSDFNADLDRFSIFSMYVGLRALAVRPDLWTRFDGGDERVLFTKHDYADPEGSALFRELDGIADIKELVDRFASVCKGTFTAIPSLDDFLDGRFHYVRFVPGVVRTRPSAPPPSATGTLFAQQPPQMGWPPPQPGPQPGFRQAYQAPFQTPYQVPYQAAYQAPTRKRNPAPIIVGILIVLGIIFVNAHAHRSHAGTRVARQQTQQSVTTAESQPPTFQEETSAPTTPLPTASPTPRPTMSPTPASTLTPSQADTTTAATLAQAATNDTPTPIRSVSHRDTQASQALADAASDTTSVTATQRSASYDSNGGSCSTPTVSAKLTSLAQPVVPADVAALAAGKSAKLLVALNADGTVKNLWVLTSSGNDALDVAAQNAARASSYRPAYQACAPVAGTVNVTVSF
ncbi:MAG: TonB family protein [bacterium]|nr:TonB family protein [bacterium]